MVPLSTTVTGDICGVFGVPLGASTLINTSVETLARPGAARAFLKHFLPAEVRAALDLSEPEMVQDSFVDAELRSHRADLLYQVRLRDGREAYAYVLFEHKSIPDRWVAFQLLRYMIRIWERNWRERGELWPIVPLVVYHGRDQWWVEPTLGELIDAPAPLKAYMPDYGYLLCDLTAYTDEDLKGKVLLQAAMLALKYVFRPDLGEHLPGLMDLLRELAARDGSGIRGDAVVLSGASSDLRGDRGVEGGGRDRFSPGGRGANVYHSTEVGRART